MNTHADPNFKPSWAETGLNADWWDYKRVILLNASRDAYNLLYNKTNEVLFIKLDYTKSGDEFPELTYSQLEKYYYFS